MEANFSYHSSNIFRNAKSNLSLNGLEHQNSQEFKSNHERKNENKTIKPIWLPFASSLSGNGQLLVTNEFIWQWNMDSPASLPCHLTTIWKQGVIDKFNLSGTVKFNKTNTAILLRHEDCAHIFKSREH